MFWRVPDLQNKYQSVGSFNYTLPGRVEQTNNEITKHSVKPAGRRKRRAFVIDQLSAIYAKIFWREVKLVKFLPSCRIENKRTTKRSVKKRQAAEKASLSFTCHRDCAKKGQNKKPRGSALRCHSGEFLQLMIKNRMSAVQQTSQERRKKD